MQFSIIAVQDIDTQPMLVRIGTMEALVDEIPSCVVLIEIDRLRGPSESVPRPILRRQHQIGNGDDVPTQRSLSQGLEEPTSVYSPNSLAT